ncbi:hypothetical protein OSB04_un000500, partial [Centaurea solstitialis]
MGKAICCLLLIAMVFRSHAVVVDIKARGAKGDGKTDDGPMDDDIDMTIGDDSTPRWEIMNAKEQSFIQLDSPENFMVMLTMYKDEAEVTIYVTTDKLVQQSGDELIEECDDGNDSNSNCPSEESYHSRHSTDDEYEFLNDESES